MQFFSNCILLLLLSSMSAFAQSFKFKWGITQGSDSDATSPGLCIDGDGNIIITGSYTNRNILFGSKQLLNSSLKGESDIFLVKYQTNGEELWAIHLGSKGIEKAYSVAVDSFNNIFVAGSFTSPVVISGSDTLVNNGNNTADIALFKFDKNGNTVWARSIGGVDNEEGLSITTDKNNQVLITGSFSSNIMFADSVIVKNNGNLSTSDIFFAKYDLDGSILWMRTAGGLLSDEASKIITDKDNNILLTGSFNSPELLIDAITLTNAGINTADAFIAKYDSNGNILWAKNMRGNSDEVSNSIVALTDGTIALTGYFNSVFITSGAKTLINAGKNTADVFLIKYDADGNELLASTYGGRFNDIANGISANASNELFITGCEYDTLGKSYDAYIIKYNATGMLTWKKKTIGPSDEIAQNVCTDVEGNIFVTGKARFNRTTNVSFGNVILSHSFYSRSSMKTFLVKYENTGLDKWVKGSEGLMGNVETNGIVADADNNMYVTGGFYGKSIKISDTIIVNSDTSGKATDFFLAKFNSSGKFVWARTCKTKDMTAGRSLWGMGLTIDSTGNVIVTGSYKKSNLIFGNYTVPNGSFGYHTDIFIAKYDPTGTVLWANGAGSWYNSSHPGDCFPNSISSDKNGNILIAGTFYSDEMFPFSIKNKGGSDVFVAKFNAAGKLLWARGGGSTTVDHCKDAKIDQDGNVLITGYFSNKEIIFGTDTIKPNSLLSNTNFFLVKYDSSGNLQWKKTAVYHDQSSSVFCEAVTTDKDNNVIISGLCGGTVSFDSLITNSSGTFVLKYSSTGEVLWINTDADILSTQGWHRPIITDAKGNIFTAGATYNASGKFGPYQFTNSGLDTYDAVFMEYTPDGRLIGAQSLMGNSDDEIRGMCIDNQGNIILEGDTESHELLAGNLKLKNNGGKDFFLIKLNDTFVGIEELKKETKYDLIVYPNPTNGPVKITSLLTISEIQVHNMLGQLIYLTKSNGKEFSLSLQYSGVYFITAILSTQRVTKKVIVN